MDPRRRAVIAAIAALDDEGFNAIAWATWQQSMTAGGYKDKAGWDHLRRVLDRYTELEMKEARNARNAAYKNLDEAPPITVKDTK